MDVDEKIQFVLGTVEPMALHTRPYVASVVGVEPDGGAGRHVGSALRVVVGGRRAIVTAAHVLAQAREQFGRVAVSATRGAAPHEVTGAVAALDEVRDVAVLPLDDAYPTDGIAFWPADRPDPEPERVATDFLFVHGFPAVLSRFSELANGLVSRSLPYGVMQRDDDLPPDLHDFQFAMDFDPQNLLGPDGQRAEWLDPHGLSGSPVWRIGASGLAVDRWPPGRAVLVGVVTQWRPDEKLLVATRWPTSRGPHGEGDLR
jgi:hypothetical protein